MWNPKIVSEFSFLQYLQCFSAFSIFSSFWKVKINEPLRSQAMEITDICSLRVDNRNLTSESDSTPSFASCTKFWPKTRIRTGCFWRFAKPTKMCRNEPKKAENKNSEKNPRINTKVCRQKKKSWCEADNCPLSGTAPKQKFVQIGTPFRSSRWTSKKRSYGRLPKIRQHKSTQHGAYKIHLKQNSEQVSQIVATMTNAM